MGQLKKQRILVVDDTAFTRDITIKLLLELGINSTTIDQSENGNEAWKTLVNSYQKGFPYTLVLCDWNMPYMNGLELLKKVRSEENFKDLPFILVTTESEKDKIIEAVSHKVSNYIIKPISLETLKPKISDFLIEE